MAKSAPAPPLLRMKQICTGQYSGPTGESYRVLGLGQDGKVYVWSATEEGWIGLRMRRLENSNYGH